MFRPFPHLLKTLLSLLLFAQAHGQSPSVSSPVQGLAGNVIYNVSQDSRGYILVCGEAGFSRYDGYAFHHLDMDDGLSDSDVFRAVEDSRGRLWLHTNNGKPTIIDGDSILTAANYAPLADIHGGSMTVSSMLQQQDGSFWHTTWDTAYKLVDDHVVQKLAATDHFSKDNRLYGAVAHGGNTILLTTHGLVNAETGHERPFVNFAIDDFISKHVLVGHELYISMTNRLFVHDMTTGDIREIPLPWDSFVLNLQRDADDGIWIAQKGHLYRMDCLHGTFEFPIPHQFAYPSSVLRDNEGNLWVSTLSNGLHFFPDPELLPVHQLSFVTSDGAMACHGLVAHNDCIYAGFENAEYALVQRGSIVHRNAFPEIGTHYRRKVTQFLPMGDELVVGASSVLLKQDAHGKMVDYLAAPRAICSDGHRRVYAAYGSYLVHADADSLEKLFSNYLTLRNRTVVDDRIQTILYLGTDSLLVGSVSGLRQWVRDQWYRPEHWKHRVFHAPVMKAVQINTDAIAFATRGAGIAIMTADSTFVLTTATGLPSNNWNALHASNDSTLWAAGSKGLVRLDIQWREREPHVVMHHFPHITTHTGERINAITTVADTVWIGTDKGLFYFRNNDSKNAQFPRLHLERLWVNDSLSSFHDGLALPHFSNRLTFDFVGLLYHAQGRVNYRYMLKGVDSDWNETVARRATYAYLPPGDYTFLLSAANVQGIWNPEPLAFHFTIRSPFWQLPWFIALMVVVGLGVLASVVFFFLMRQRKKHLQQQHLLQLEMEHADQERQLAQLQQRALQAQMNPHFIFNSINSIQGFYASGDAAGAKEYIGLFSDLLRRVLESSSETFIALDKEVLILKGYLQLAALRYKEKFDHQVSVDASISPSTTHLPAMLIQPIVENALLHGIAALEQKGSIQVHFQREGNDLVCTVADNGVGRIRATELKRSATHRSLGLKLVEARIHILYGDQVAKPAVSIVDRTDAEGNAIGTEVTVRIPIFDNGR